MPQDHQLVCDVLAGDRNGFRVLVERHQGAVFAVVRAFLRDGQEAEDVAQDAFVSAFTHLSSFDPARGPFRAWLLAIARNRCRDVLRKHRPQPGATETVLVEDATRPTDDAHRRLDRALARLSPERQVAFLLVDVFQMPLEEVATIEGVPVGTVKSRASRARAALREELRACLEEPQ